MTATPPPSSAQDFLNVGDAVTVDDRPGFWLVTHTDTHQADRDRRTAGLIRVHKVWDGGGPPTTIVNVPAAAVRLIVEAEVDRHATDHEPARVGYRLTAGRGAILIVPRHPAACVTDSVIVDRMHQLQFLAGLPFDARLLERAATGWVPAAARFQAVLTTSGIFRVHQKGCADLQRADTQSPAPIDLTAITPASIARELHADFIDDGSMQAGEAVDFCRFLPCSRIG